MPLLLRHLAVVLLPLASTTAGILAVDIALQLPAGPAVHVEVPAEVTTPVAGGSPIVVRVAPRAKPPVAAPTAIVRPGGVPRADREPAVPVEASPADVVQGLAASQPILLPDESEPAPLTPPVAPAPEPEPSTPEPEPGATPTPPPPPPPAATPVSPPPAVTVAAVTGKKQKAQPKGKKPHKAPKPKQQAAVALLSQEPALPGQVTDPAQGATKKDKDKDKENDKDKVKPKPEKTKPEKPKGKGAAPGDGESAVGEADPGAGVPAAESATDERAGEKAEKKEHGGKDGKAAR